MYNRKQWSSVIFPNGFASQRACWSRVTVSSRGIFVTLTVFYLVAIDKFFLVLFFPTFHAIRYTDYKFSHTILQRNNGQLMLNDDNG